ncbi:MAG TPA: UDP-N-acetylglucosamine 1-carboxyvinyltransferase [Spirochaetia bacterium]|nr:UDP-N-acetylglucosamine 1-carboxyvinyltransferase [Spirochaetia bacterium]
MPSYQYAIEGGVPLKGRVRASGNKNAALPCLAATLLTDQPVTLRNLPEIEDVRVMIEILTRLGSRVEKLGHNEYRLQTLDISREEVPPDLAQKIRASILFAGPLLARKGRVFLPPPGGDVIGRRPLDTHFLALADLGAVLETGAFFTLTARRLRGADLFLDEASVTATENVVMAAVLAEGTTVIENAASEPHIQDLCRMLVSMGARIQGIGSNVLSVEGVRRLAGTDFRIGSDFMEVGSLIGLAAATRGDLEIEDACPKNLRMMKLGFSKLGVSWDTSGDSIHVPAGLDLKVVPTMGGQIPKIDDAPWPGFPADIISIALVVATQAEGTVLIHEKMFESRMFYVDKLISMGAKIILCDPHRAVVSGPSRLTGADLVSPDVRAGMAMLIAALCAQGRSCIQNVYQIERGYENLTARLQALGARIKRNGDCAT